MSECVVRMEMPEGCWDCPCVNGEYGYCQAYKEYRQIEDPNERPSWCPIICSIPEGHGTLIDLETAAEGLSERFNSCHMTCGAVMQFLDGLPTLVPAERSET